MLSLVVGLLMNFSSAEIVPGYDRGISVAEVSTKHNVRVLEETHIPSGDRPRFDHVVFLLEQQRIFDVPVSLRFEFFNGDLMQVDLFPASPEGVAQVRAGVADMHGITPAQLSAGANIGGLLLYESEDASGRGYVAVSINEVLGKFNAWIERYS